MRLGLPRTLWILIAAGAVLRIVWALLHDVTPIEDFQEYDRLAQSVAFDGYYGFNGDARTYRPPGWPVSLAAVYWVFGHDLTMARLLAAIVSALVLIPTAVIANRLLAPRYAALAVGALAFYPTWIAYSSVLGTEHLGALLLTTMVAVMVTRRPDLPTGIAIGALEGLLFHARGDFGIAMALVVLLWLWMRSTSPRMALRSAAAAALVGAVVLAPWVIRNHYTYDEFIPTTTNAGQTFYLATLDADYSRGPKITDAPGEDTPREFDSFYWELGWENVRDDPVQWMKFNVQRFALGFGSDVRVLAWAEVAPFGGAAYFLADAYAHLLLLLALAGIVALLIGRHRLDQVWWIVLGTVAMALLLKLVFVFDARHRLNLMPLFCIFAALGVAELARWIRGGEASRTA